MLQTTFGDAGFHARVTASFVIIRAVWKGLVLLLLPLLLRADALEDAAHLLTAKIASHLSTQERAHIVTHNLSTMPPSSTARVRSTIETTLRKPTAHRTPVDVVVTISENASGFLLIAEVHKPDADAVEMEPLKLTSAAPPLTTPPALTKRLLWQQNEPILDLVQSGDHMLVLQPQSLAAFELRDKQWQPSEQVPLEVARIRDPRGHLEIQASDVTAYLPGATCRGTWQPLHLTCDPQSSDFAIGPAKVHFVPARNALEGFPPTQFDDELPFCNSKKLAASTNPRSETDTVAIFEGPTAISDAVPLPGPVTALWPTTSGALAIIHNLSTNQYAAYALTVDCGQ